MGDEDSKSGPLVHCEVKDGGGGSVRFQSYIQDGSNENPYHTIVVSPGHGQHLQMPYETPTNIVHIFAGGLSWNRIWSSSPSIKNDDLLLIEFQVSPIETDWILYLNGTQIADGSLD